MSLPITNVQVIEEDGAKIVNLRSVDRSTHPWTYETVDSAPAGDHVSEHSRNCDFDDEARRYFELLRK